MHVFLSNLAYRQTDISGPTHLPPPLSAVKICEDWSCIHLWWILWQ